MSKKWHQETAATVRDAIRAREVSAAEVTQAYLGRIDEVDGKVQAYIDVWRDSALARAETIDIDLEAGKDRGPLAGVPVGLKDVLCTTEGTTGCCSKILKRFRSPFNATVVEKLLAAGVVPLGKNNMDEFAMGSSTENSSRQITRNPWDLERVPGGSSGGSAAAVVADECAFSIGSDTGGSIRQPAALCGCVGMKPTYGRVSRYGLVAFASSLDQIGPFTKDITDMALVLNVICGQDPKDSTSAALAAPDFTQALRDDVGGLTIGLPKEYFSDDLGQAMREQIEAAIKVLEKAGAKIAEVSLPHTDYGISAYYIVCTAEASANLARFDGVRYGARDPKAKNTKELYHLTRSAGFGPEVQRRILLGTYVLSSGYYDAYYLKAQKVRALIQRDFTEAFKICDVIACPTTPSAAFKIGEKVDDPLDMYLSDVFTVAVNLAGVPGMSMPCGLTAEGLPAGLQLIGKPFDEATLLRVGYTYEKNRPAGLGRPPIA